MVDCKILNISYLWILQFLNTYLWIMELLNTSHMRMVQFHETKQKQKILLTVRLLKFPQVIETISEQLNGLLPLATARQQAMRMVA
jgi:hypothetical protein